MTRSGWTVVLAWSKAFTNACFSAALICMIFLLTGARLKGWRMTVGGRIRGFEVREERREENVLKN